MDVSQQRVIVISHGQTELRPQEELTERGYNDAALLTQELLQQLDLSDPISIWSSPRFSALATSIGLTRALGAKVKLSNCLESRFNSEKDADYCGLGCQQYIPELLQKLSPEVFESKLIMSQHTVQVELSNLQYPEPDEHIVHRVKTLIDFINTIDSKQAQVDDENFILEIPRTICLFTHPLVLDLLADKFKAETEGTAVKFLNFKSVVTCGSCELIALKKNASPELVIVAEDELNLMISQVLRAQREKFDEVTKSYLETIRQKEIKYHEVENVATEALAALMRANEALRGLNVSQRPINPVEADDSSRRQPDEVSVLQSVEHPAAYLAQAGSMGAHEPSLQQASSVPQSMKDPDLKQGDLNPQHAEVPLLQEPFEIDMVDTIENTLCLIVKNKGRQVADKVLVYCYETNAYSRENDLPDDEVLAVGLEEFKMKEGEKYSFVLARGGAIISNCFVFEHPPEAVIPPVQSNPAAPQIFIELEQQEDGYLVTTYHTYPYPVSGFLWCDQLGVFLSGSFELQTNQRFEVPLNISDADLLKFSNTLIVKLYSLQNEELMKQDFSFD
jgi:broad specificity phosphatase PhoE